MPGSIHPLLPGLVASGEGRYVHFRALGTRYIARSDEFCVVEHDLAPRSLGAPLHRHQHEDETSFVTQGRLGVQLGEEVVVAGPGDVVRKPRHQWHAFWNAGDEECRFYELITPPGFGEYFVEIAPFLNADPPDLESLGAAMKRYGLEMDMGVGRQAYRRPRTYRSAAEVALIHSIPDGAAQSECLALMALQVVVSVGTTNGQMKEPPTFSQVVVLSPWV
jgi:mannose-6-phosphate isomerase-like protein (cupin superfamily)